MPLTIIIVPLPQDLSSQGVGLGSVHARLHPQIIQHCGVSHVPSIVGVVSGRVHRYYGQLRDKNTIISFLDNILPKHIITLVSPQRLSIPNGTCICSYQKYLDSRYSGSLKYCLLDTPALWFYIDF